MPAGASHIAGPGQRAKARFTLLAGATAAGQMLPGFFVIKGQTQDVMETSEALRRLHNQDGFKIVSGYIS